MKTFATIILTAVPSGVITFLATWWSVSATKGDGKSKSGSPAPEEFVPHRTIKIYLTRRRVAAERIAITNRAQKGDTVFGSCKGCYDDDVRFNDALARAVARGVTLQCVVTAAGSAREFIEFLKGLDQSKIHLWTCKGDYPRTYGIEGREIMFAFDRGQHYFGVHLTDPAVLDVVSPGLRSFRQESIEG